MESQVDSGGVTSKPATGEVPKGVHRHATLDRDSTTGSGQGTQQAAGLPGIRPALLTLTKVLTDPEPPGYRQTQARRKRKLEPLLPIIHAILEKTRRARATLEHVKQGEALRWE